jgi:hypothetical protein
MLEWGVCNKKKIVYALTINHLENLYGYIEMNNTMEKKHIKTNRRDNIPFLLKKLNNFVMQIEV